VVAVADGEAVEELVERRKVQDTRYKLHDTRYAWQKEFVDGATISQV
jgi:hypothetical protein